MGEVVHLWSGDHARTSAKKSGLIFSRGMPVSFSISGTRSKGTPCLAQRVTVLLFTSSLRAKSANLSPLAASSDERAVVMPDSCTTHNAGQGISLRKSLTTSGAGIGILATMPKALSKPQPEPPARIYAGRQPTRPHYLAALLRAKNVTRATLIEELGIDKSLVSRWLDEDRPTTPGRHWQKELGRYLASDPDDFVDIFTDPNVSRFQRLTRGLSAEQVDQMLSSLEAAFKIKKTGSKP